jgi:hypothetical protein
MSQNKTLRNQLLKLLERKKELLYNKSSYSSLRNLINTAKKPRLDFLKDELNRLTIRGYSLKSFNSNYSYFLGEPKFVSETIIDRFSIFERRAFVYSNVRSEQKFYNAIKDAMRRYPQATSLVVYFKPRVGNLIRRITISIDNLTNFNDFHNAVYKIIEGNFVGSDAVDLDEYTPIYTNFHLNSIVIPASGKSDKILFDCVGIDGEKYNDCGLKTINHIMGEGYLTDMKKVDTLFKMKKFIEDNKLNITIILNSFTLKKPHFQIINEGVVETLTINEKGNDKIYKAVKLNIEDIDVVKYHDAKSDKIIIYDEFNKHFDVINSINLYDDVYITMSCKIVKNNKVIFTPKILKDNGFITNSKNKFKYLFFDYETVIDFKKSSCMREYSLSILDIDNDTLEQLNDADINKDIKTINTIRTKCCKTFTGFNCSNDFIDWFLENQKDALYCFVGYNNSNFDNFILLDALLRYEKREIDITNIFYNGSSLNNFEISNRHNFFDIHKHLMGSLKDNCNSFKINCCSKKDFNHNEVQQKYLNNTLIDWINKDDKLIEYNEFDNIATAVLFSKYRRALKDIDAMKPYADNLHNIGTIGSLIYKCFDDSIKNKKIKLPKLKIEQYEDLQKCKIAGRVELFNGVQKIKEKLVSTDVCSLYPYVMSVLNCYYPCGDVIDTDKYMGDDVIGFYYCDIDQRNLKKSNLPNIYAFKTELENKWDYEGVIENYLISNVMIRLLKKHNCIINIKKGFYFSDKKKSCDMFDIILDFMAEKNKQDDIKDKPEYNSALRETLKLLMNSLSGKVIEGLHTEQTRDINSLAEYEKIKNKSSKINCINNIGNKLFITYEVEAETIINKQKPIYLGALIYDYAKEYMYNYSYSKIGLDKLLYTDTDATKFRYDDFLKWKEWVEKENIIVLHWTEVEKKDPRYKTHLIYQKGSKVFGSFEDELEKMNGENYIFYCLEKKSWLYGVDGKTKFRFKGVNENSIILNMSEDFIDNKTIKHKNGMKEIKYFIKEDTEEKVYNYFVNSNDTVKNKSIDFFEKIYTEKEAYIICNVFRKIVKNTLQNVGVADVNKFNNLMNKIQVQYCLKHIKIN